MPTWHMKGQSNYDNATGFHMGLYLDMNGFDSTGYEGLTMEKDSEEGDPFLAVGIKSIDWSYGQQQVEFGLLGSHRIRITSAGVRIWTAGDVWEDPLTGGAGGDLGDLDDVVIDGTPADNELLAWDNGTSKWINQTAGEAGLAVSGHTHGQLHDEDHDNTHHTTNYHTETDGTGVATVHSDITSTGSQSIITTDERNALHAIYTLEQHNNDYHDPDFCLDDDSRLSDARTPTAHVLNTSGPHTGPLQLSDLGSWAQGRMIIGGALEWLHLLPGTEDYVLKMGATYPGWGQVDFSELTGSLPSHDFDTHDGDVDLADLGGYAQGRMIIGGASDWLYLVPGTENYVLAMGATYPSWTLLTEAHISDLGSYLTNPMTEDLGMGDFDIENAGTIYFDATNRYWLRQSSDGTEGGVLSNGGFAYNPTGDGFYVRGDALLYLGVTGNDSVIVLSSTNDGAQINNALIRMDGQPGLSGGMYGSALMLDDTGCSVFDAVYIDTTDSVLPAKADVIGTARCVGIFMGSDHIVSHGVVRNDSWSFSSPYNKPQYVSAATAGQLTETPPTIPVVVGFSCGDHELFVCPGWSTYIDKNADLHSRQHSIASASDHTMTANRLLYSNTSGVITELAYGALGKVLKSNGPSSDPTWQDDDTGGGGGMASDYIHVVSTSAEFNTALATCAIDNKGWIVFEADIANCAFNAINDASMHLRISGISPGITLDANGNADIFVVTTCASLIIENLTFDLTDHTATLYYGIECNNAADTPVWIRNCYFYGDSTSYSECIYVNSNYVTVSECRFYNSRYGISAGTNSYYVKIINNTFVTMDVAIIVGTCYDWVIQGNNVNGVTQYGIYTPNGMRHNITGNTLRSCDARAIYVHTCPQTVVSSNLCWEGEGGIGIQIHESHDCIVSGNLVYDYDANSSSTTAGIWISGNSLGCDYTTVTGNVVTGCHNTGSGTAYSLRVNNIQCDEVTIVGNCFIGNDTDTISDAGNNTYTSGNNDVDDV